MVSWFGFVEVPQGHVAIVERYGKYDQTLQPGLNWINPLSCSIKDLSTWRGRATKLDRFIEMSEQMWPVEKIECITNDHLNIKAGLTIHFKIAENEGVSQAKRAVYAVDVFPDSLIEICLESLRTKINSCSFDQFFSSRQKIGQAVAQEVAAKVNRWGVKLLGVDVTDLELDPKLSTAMEQRRVAETLHATAEIEAKTKKLEAENKAYVSMVQAKSEADQRQIVNRAEIEYIRDLSDCLGSGRASEVIKAEKVSNAFSAIAGSPNTKTIMVPSEFKGMLKLVQDKGL